MKYTYKINEYFEEADCSPKKRLFSPKSGPKILCTLLLRIQQSTLRVCLKFSKGTTCKQN